MRSLLAAAIPWLTLGAAYLLLRSQLKTSPSEARRLATTMWKSNPDVQRSLMAQIAEARVGAAVLFLTFGAQMIVQLIPATFADFEVNPVVLLLGAAIAGVVIYFATLLADLLTKRMLADDEDESEVPSD